MQKKKTLKEEQHKNLNILTALLFLPTQYMYKYIGHLNIHGTHMSADKSTNNNAVVFFVSDLKIVYYNNY